MFVNTLPLFFSQITYISPIELLIIFLGFYVVLFMTSPIGEKLVLAKPFDNYLFLAWTGGINLFWVFWPCFLLFNMGLYTTDVLTITGTLTVSSWDDIHIVLLLPMLWWATGVWRCSANCSYRMWSASARLMIFCVIFEYGLRLLIRMDYPRLFFNCEELLMDYGSCF